MGLAVCEEEELSVQTLLQRPCMHFIQLMGRMHKQPFLARAVMRKIEICFDAFFYSTLRLGYKQLLMAWHAKMLCSSWGAQT